MSGADREGTDGALVLFSGGQDSATCLAWACARFERVETVGFDYGQRHSVEMEARGVVRQAVVNHDSGWAEKLGADHIIPLHSLGSISDTALTRDVEIAVGEDGLPNTFVPGRNLVFLALAAALGYRRGLSDLVGGMCEEDFSGYPDCRRPALDAQMKAIALGMDRPFRLHTPLMALSKAGAWQLAEELGGEGLVEIIRRDSHTCYLGEREMHAWGAGCGTCPACELRARGWAEYAGV